MPRNQYTLYDALEQKGLFDSNVANAGARTESGDNISVWPVAFPTMVYHPQGEERIAVPAELVDTKQGVRERNEQRELLNKIVQDQGELDAALADGWHLHPADAIAASGRKAPPRGAMPHEGLASTRALGAANAEIEKLKEQLEAMQENERLRKEVEELKGKLAAEGNTSNGDLPASQLSQAVEHLSTPGALKPAAAGGLLGKK